MADAPRVLLVLVLSCVGLGATFWAWWNLIGVPMQEASSMHPRDGWIAVAVAVAAFSLAAWVFKQKG